MCACKRHVGSRFDIGTNYRITADEQLLGSALATCSTVSYDNWGVFILELVENKISSEYDITLAPNVSLNALFGLVHVRIYKFFWPQISAHARFLFCFVWRLRPLSVFNSQNKASTNIW